LGFSDKNSSAIPAFCGLMAAMACCGLTAARAVRGPFAAADAELTSPLIAGVVISTAATAIKAAMMPDLGRRADALTSPQFACPGATQDPAV
jgi:hypothetical protein